MFLCKALRIENQSYFLHIVSNSQDPNSEKNILYPSHQVMFRLSKNIRKQINIVLYFRKNNFFTVKFKIYIRKHCLQLKKGIPNATQLQKSIHTYWNSLFYFNKMVKHFLKKKSVLKYCEILPQNGFKQEERNPSTFCLSRAAGG